MRWASFFRLNWTSTNWGKWILTAGSGYGYMISVLITTAIITPSAVHYLGVREYGLWAITIQLMSYVRVFDFGLGRSMQRLVSEAMIEHNEEGSRRYTLLWCFSGLMAIVLFIIGLLTCRLGLQLLAVPHDLMGVGTILFIGLTAIFCFGYAFVPCQGILYAQNRTYLTGFMDTLALWLNFGLFLFFLHRGDGLLSYLYASLINAPICLCLGVYLVFQGPPVPRFNFSFPSWSDFRVVFGFSGKIFVNGFITELQMTYPIFVISHYAGLAATGRFYVGWRLATFLYQFTLQPSEGLMPRWQNLYLTGRMDRLRHEFSETCILMCQLALVAGTCFAAGFKPLLMLWMGKNMYAGSAMTFALSFYIVIYILFAYLPKPFIWGKAFVEMALPLVAEIIFVCPLCIWVIQTQGIGPMILTAVGGTALLTVSYYWVRGPRFIGLRKITESWKSRDFADLAFQAAFLVGALLVTNEMNRRGAPLDVEFGVGGLLSAAAILFLCYSQWPRLKRIYQERRGHKTQLSESPAISRAEEIL